MLNIWSEQDAKRNLAQRLTNAINDRKDLERRWVACERTIFTTNGQTNYSDLMNNNISGFTENMDGGVDQGSTTVGINYAFKDLRFLHAQLSANPPSVVPQPNTNDPDDRRRADAANRLVKYALREYQMQENVDKANLNTLLYGTGITKDLWDPHGGDPLSFDESTGKYEMEGTYKISVPSVWDIYIDPDATKIDDILYVFERVLLNWEEVLYEYPEKKDLLKKYRLQNGEEAKTSEGFSGSILNKNNRYDSVELFEYWEKGTKANGFIGRYCLCTRDGDLISPLKENPEQYRAPANVPGEKKMPVAVLPYHFFTDIDVPDQVWGKSAVEYTVSLQDKLNRIDNLTLDNVQAHGVARLILPENAEVADSSITNSPYDIIKITGGQPLHFIPPMQLPTVITDLMIRYKSGIDDMYGVNESMFGQQSREQSGFSMQYATNQGNMIRRRLFNKYVLFVEQIYKRYLQIVQKKWSTSRTVKTLGKENAFEVKDIKGADIDGGYDLQVTYGTDLSLDPISRREEMLTLMPLFKEAGVSPRTMLGMLRLSELSSAYDKIEMANNRQREYFEKIISSGVYLPPEELEDHTNMLLFAYDYRMSTEFTLLDLNIKAEIIKHIRAREQMKAEELAAAQGSIPAAGPVTQDIAGGEISVQDIPAESDLPVLPVAG